MRHQIVRTFDDYSAAEQALNHLLSAGFDRDLVHVDVMRDEGGPEQGNFTVGDDPRVKGGTDYSKTYKPEEDHSHAVVVVDAPSASEADRAAAILADHGAVIDDPAWRKLAKGD